MDGNALISKYICQNDTKTFDEIVSRHYSLVYRSAYARTRDPHMAEDVTTSVFMLLAERKEHFDPNVVLVGWLYKTAYLMACNAVRDEKRRQNRENNAAIMAEELSQGQGDDRRSEKLTIINDALMLLSESDRNAVLLRYAQGCSSNEMALLLNVSPEAAKKRASRAMERLRNHCAQSGLPQSATAICRSFNRRDRTQRDGLGLLPTA